jgi:hypothetical protein
MIGVALLAGLLAVSSLEGMAVFLLVAPPGLAAVAERRLRSNGYRQLASCLVWYYMLALCLVGFYVIGLILFDCVLHAPGPFAGSLGPPSAVSSQP